MCYNAIVVIKLKQQTIILEKNQENKMLDFMYKII